MAGNFFEQVYEIVKRIPVGRVASYGAVARALGTRDARRVGQALHVNPYEGVVPCHRVVARDGRLAPNFAFDGAAEQRRRLLVEGVDFVDEMHVDMNKCGWKFSILSD